MDKIISYIIRFLIGGSRPGAICAQVGYTADVSKFGRYSVVIIPSTFFQNDVYGTDASIPELPLKEIEGTPLLFGTPDMEWVNGTLIIHADIIASTYFLISRYEEIRRRNVRDVYGRFPGKESLPYRAGFIHRPVVDEYGKLLRKWLNEAGAQLSEPEQKIKKTWLTHDVDAPFFCRSLRGVLRETFKKKNIKEALRIYKGKVEDDPYYTFPWLIEQNNILKKRLGKSHCESIFFVKGGGKSKQDKPAYNLYLPDMQTLLSLFNQKQAIIGLHSSFDAGKKPALISSELETLEKASKKNIQYNRHHYLASREPEDMDWLERAGITDDFTMGYADVSGFRLGTCRPVQWINPVTKRLSPLRLHPLTIMDCSLSEKKYMGLNYEQAQEYSLQLIKQVTQMNGELVLLWHNTTVQDSTKCYHRTLYSFLLNELAAK